MIPHQPRSYASDRSLGYHSSEAIYLNTEDAPEYVRQYVTAHELVHDRLFAGADGLVHRMIIRATHSESPTYDPRAAAVASFLWDEMDAPHERAATYIAAMQFPDPFPRQSIVRGFPEPYKQHFRYYDEIVQNCSKNSNHQLLAAWALATWSFQSARLLEILPKDAFDLAAYKRIPGPPARLEAARKQLQPNIAREWLEDTLRYFCQETGVPLDDLSRPEFWIADNFQLDSAHSTKITDTLHNALVVLIGLPSCPKEVHTSELSAFLQEGLSEPWHRGIIFPSHPGTVTDPVHMLAHARQGDRLRTFSKHPASKLESMQDMLRFLDTSPAGCRIYSAITWTSSDELISVLTFESDSKLFTYNDGPVRLSFLEACFLMSILREIHQGGVNVAPITVCFEASTVDDALNLELLLRNLMAGWTAVTHYNPNLEQQTDKPLFMPILSACGAWAEVLIRREGIGYFTIALQQSLGNESPFIFSLFTDFENIETDDEKSDWPALNIFPPSANDYYTHIHDKLAADGSMEPRKIPDGSPFFTHLALSSWLSLNLPQASAVIVEPMLKEDNQDLGL